MSSARRRNPHVPAVTERAERVRLLDIVSSTFGFAGGYATIAEHLAAAIEARGIGVRLPSVMATAGAVTIGADILARSLTPEARDARGDALTYIGPPTTWKADPTRRIFGFASLECDLVSAMWASTTVSADEIWAPTEFVRDAFEASGSRRPVVVARPGIDPSVFAYHSRSRGQRLRFLHFATRVDDPRKGADVAVAAFKAAFHGRDDVSLTLRSTFTDTFAPILTGDSRIVRQTGRITPEELAKVYYAHDALVCTSRFENTALTALEAIATGMPAIFGDAGGFADLVPFGLSVPTRRIGAMRSSAGISTGGCWFEPSIDAVIERMREVDRNYDPVQKRARANSEAVTERFTWDAFAEAIIARLT